MATKPIKFEASARLQRLIGRDLIPNEQMAIVELVKNAYDSNASSVQIFVQPETPREPGLIRITDDGDGMSEADIRSLFMFAGYSKRPDQLDTAKRTPTGEKGIGRFAADKLGRTLDVFTSKRLPDGIHLHIDWRRFEVKGNKKFSDVVADFVSADVSHKIRSKSGTVLEIGQLRSGWGKEEVAKLEAWLSDLLDPFSKPKNFSIVVEIGGSKRGIFKIDPRPPRGNISMEIAISNDKVRKVVREPGTKEPLVDEQQGSTADLAALKGVHARFVHFDRRPQREETNGLPSGVRIYRDGFRIEPFGSRDSDWLGVAERRAKRAGHAHVVPNRLFGFVEISRTKNPTLIDTTSRQALLDTDAARNLVTLLREGLASLNDVLRDRTEPRWQENRRRKQVELEQARLFTLGEVAAGLAHELRQPLQAIRSEAENIRVMLEQRGIRDGDIADSQQAIDRSIARIDKSITLVSNLSKGDLSDVAPHDLAQLLRQEVDVFANMCTPKGIKLKLEGPETQTANINEAAVLTIIGNFLRNAMQSIEDPNGGSIVVALSKKGAHHRIEVQDNGAGVPIEVVPQLFKKFATKKTGGMGVGLHHCRTLVESYGGRIGHVAMKKGALFWVEIPEG